MSVVAGGAAAVASVSLVSRSSFEGVSTGAEHRKVGAGYGMVHGSQRGMSTNQLPTMEAWLENDGQWEWRERGWLPSTTMESMMARVLNEIPQAAPTMEAQAAPTVEAQADAACEAFVDADERPIVRPARTIAGEKPGVRRTTALDADVSPVLRARKQRGRVQREQAHQHVRLAVAQAGRARV